MADTSSLTIKKHLIQVTSSLKINEFNNLKNECLKKGSDIIIMKYYLKNVFSVKIKNYNILKKYKKSEHVLTKINEINASLSLILNEVERKYNYEMMMMDNYLNIIKKICGSDNELINNKISKLYKTLGDMDYYEESDDDHDVKLDKVKKITLKYKKQCKLLINDLNDIIPNKYHKIFFDITKDKNGIILDKIDKNLLLDLHDSKIGKYFKIILS